MKNLICGPDADWDRIFCWTAICWIGSSGRRGYLPEGGALQEGVSTRFLAKTALFFEGSGWLAALSLDGDDLRCQELLGNPDTAYGIVAAFGCREGFFRIPGPDKPFAQGVKLNPNCHFPSYFGLAFD